MAPLNRRGMTLIELMVSLIIIATIATAMVVMFKIAVTANKFCSTETTFLTNVVQALQGNGPTRGMLFDTLYASSVTATGASTLATSAPSNSGVTYSLSSTNLLRGDATLATGLTNLAFNYYTLSASGTITTASSAPFARLVTVSFQTSLSRGTTFYAGAIMRNHL